MRISDWSSDVCSSDLLGIGPRAVAHGIGFLLRRRNGLEGFDHLGRRVGAFDCDRSEERRVGKECVSTCRSRWSAYHYKKHQKYNNISPDDSTAPSTPHTREPHLLVQYRMTLRI